MLIKLKDDIDNLRAGTVIEARHKPFWGWPVYEITTDKGTFWISHTRAEVVNGNKG